MVTFDVVINGNIAGLEPRRFFGGNGKPERYETGLPAEIEILRQCQVAIEITEDELKQESESDSDDPGEASPEAIESATLRGRLLAISGKDLRTKLAGRGIIKVGMNNTAVIDALLEHPEIAAEILAE